MANAPFMYWVGMNTPPDTSAGEIDKFNDFYSNVHAGEVLAANPGFMRVTRYELLEPDARGDFGPRWLVIYEMESQDAADLYLRRNDGPPEGRPKYSPGPSAWQQYEMWWRLVWRRIAPEAGEIGAAGAPYLYFVAMDVPKGTADVELMQFNDFYTRTHLPEVVAANEFLRGARYELYRGLAHPEPGSPRFLAVYEGNDESLAKRKQRSEHPESAVALSSGPPVWEQHVTAWRLLYQRISSRSA